MKIALLQPFKILHKNASFPPAPFWPSGLTLFSSNKRKKNLCEVHNCHVGRTICNSFLSKSPMRASKVPLSYITV